MGTKPKPELKGLKETLSQMGFEIEDPSIQLELENIKKIIEEDILASCQKLATQKVDEETQEEISKLVVLFQKIEKLILRTVPRNIWWEKIPNIFTPDTRSRMRHELSILIKFLQIAIKALLQEQPNMGLARSIRIDIEHIVRRYEHPTLGFFINRFVDIQRSPSTSLKVISGLIATLLFNVTLSLPVIGLYIYFEATHNEDNLEQIDKDISDTNTRITEVTRQISAISLKSNEITDSLQVPANNQPSAANTVAITIDPKVVRLNSELETLRELLITLNAQQDIIKNQQKLELENVEIEYIIQIFIVISAGTLGSIISILIRIENFQGKRYPDPLIPFLIGAFKPIIGASFGLMFFTFISSEIVSIPSIANQDDINKKRAIIFAISFVVGFSERLARDAIYKAEGMLGSSQTSPPEPPKPSSLIEENSQNQLQIQQTTQETTLIKTEEVASSLDTSIDKKEEDKE